MLHFSNEANRNEQSFVFISSIHIKGGNDSVHQSARFKCALLLLHGLKDITIDIFFALIAK